MGSPGVLSVDSLVAETREIFELANIVIIVFLFWMCAVIVSINQDKVLAFNLC